MMMWQQLQRVHYNAHHFGDQKCDVHMGIIKKKVSAHVCTRITQMVHMVQMVTLYCTMFSLPFWCIIFFIQAQNRDKQ